MPITRTVNVCPRVVLHPAELAVDQESTSDASDTLGVACQRIRKGRVVCPSSVEVTVICLGKLVGAVVAWPVETGPVEACPEDPPAEEHAAASVISTASTAASPSRVFLGFALAGASGFSLAASLVALGAFGLGPWAGAG